MVRRPFEYSLFVAGSVIVCTMKNQGGHSPLHADEALRSRRKRGAALDSNLEVLRAFADALHDILREERARLPS
jgi:hypothetical protein